MDRRQVVVAIVAAVVLWATPEASADIVAAVDVPVAAGAGTAINQHPDQFDIALLNATTGATFALPAGINTTTADEFHPSLTPDGKWLAFERIDPVAGTTRIIVANMSTGQTADLFNAFEIGTLKPQTPFVEADGGSVLAGAPFAFKPQWTATSLANFPGGPFPHTQTQLLISEPNDNQTLDPVDASFAQATTVVDGSTGLEGVIIQHEFPGGSDAAFIAPSFDKAATVGFAHPTISDPTTSVVVLERRRHGSCQSVTNCMVQAQLAFIGLGVSGNPSNLATLVNPVGADEAFPAFTPDGRYLGYVRQSSGGEDRLFVFDTVTQTLLNDQGVDLGIVGAPFSARDELRRLEGNLSLRETPVFRPLFQVFPTGLVAFQTLTSTGVGLLVQRIVGHHRLFGHVVRKLRTIGRVPLGRFSRGKHSLRWNLRVNGRRLRRGTYLVTPRSVTPRRLVTGLGTSRVLTIH